DGIRGRSVTGVQTCALPIFPFGAAGTASKEMFQRAWQVFAHGGEDAIVPWLRNAHGLKTASKYLGPAGHVLTGGLAFADRWTERSEERRVGKEGRSRAWTWQ